MKILVLLLYLVLLNIDFSFQLSEVTSRNAAVCGYLSGKIFCYGGSPDDSRYDNTIYSLSVKDQASTIVSDMNNKWNITQPNSSTIAREIRYDNEFIPLPDGVSMLFEGGSNDNIEPIANKTVTYNTTDNTWNALPDFYDASNGGYRQIYSAAAAYIPHSNCIGFFGGKQLHSIGNVYTTLSGKNWTQMGYSYNATLDPKVEIHESFSGFFYMTLFNLTDNAWYTVPSQPPQIRNDSYPFLPTHQTATYYPETKTIYFLGGIYHTRADEYTVPLSFAITFDTVNLVWNNVTLKSPIDGSLMPSPRNLHTSTLLSTNEDILVYGGTGDVSDDSLSPRLPLPDYIYTLNLRTLTWLSHSIDVPQGISGPRFYHAAVLVDETCVFILFGKPKDGVSVTNALLALDVRDASTIRYTETYPLFEKSSLSTGSIVGMVIGLIIAVLIAIVAVFLYIRKKKRDANVKLQEMEVDWDNIDTGFKEEPPVINTYNNASMSPGSTMVSSPQVPSSIEDHRYIRKSVYAPALTPDIYIIKPDNIDETAEYSINNDKINQ